MDGGKFFLSLPEPTILDNISDLDRIQRELHKKIHAPYMETSLSTSHRYKPVSYSQEGDGE